MSARPTSTASRTATFLLAAGPLFLGSGCGDSGSTPSPTPGKSATPGSLPTAATSPTHLTAVPPGSTEFALGMDATETLVRWTKAGQPAPTGGSPGDIDSDFWFPRIRELHPLRVYTHRVNLVVVTNQTAAQEEGYYVTVLLSSYAPHSAETAPDGFQFEFPAPAASPSGTAIQPSGLLRFRRTVPTVPGPEATAP